MTGAPWWLEILASGVVAATVTSVFQYWVERSRERQRVALDVLAWSDDLRTTLFAATKEAMKNTLRRHARTHVGGQATLENLLADFVPRHEEFDRLVDRMSSGRIRASAGFTIATPEINSAMERLAAGYATAADILANPIDNDHARINEEVQKLIEKVLTPQHQVLFRLISECAALPPYLAELDAALGRRRVSTPPRQS